MKHKRITVIEAAEALGVSPQFIRIGLQTGALPIGTAVKMSTMWTYHISGELLEKYAGADVVKQITKEREARA